MSTIISTTEETIIVNGNETWENLGSVAYFDGNGQIKGNGAVLFKHIPGLGNCFKLMTEKNVYLVSKIPGNGKYNARIGGVQHYANIPYLQ